MGMDIRNGVGGGRIGIDKEEWGGRWRVGIDRRSGVGGGESGDRQEEWGGRGESRDRQEGEWDGERVGIDRRSGVGGGE